MRSERISVKKKIHKTRSLSESSSEVKEDEELEKCLQNLNLDPCKKRQEQALVEELDNLQLKDEDESDDSDGERIPRGPTRSSYQPAKNLPYDRTISEKLLHKSGGNLIQKNENAGNLEVQTNLTNGYTNIAGGCQATVNSMPDFDFISDGGDRTILIDVLEKFLQSQLIDDAQSPISMTQTQVPSPITVLSPASYRSEPSPCTSGYETGPGSPSGFSVNNSPPRQYSELSQSPNSSTSTDFHIPTTVLHYATARPRAIIPKPDPEGFQIKLYKYIEKIKNVQVIKRLEFLIYSVANDAGAKYFLQSNENNVSILEQLVSNSVNLKFNNVQHPLLQDNNTESSRLVFIYAILKLVDQTNVQYLTDQILVKAINTYPHVPALAGFITEIMHKHNIDLNKPYIDEMNDGNLIHYLANSGDNFAPVLKSLLEIKGAFDVNFKNSKELTPIQVAVEYHYKSKNVSAFEIIKILARNGALLNVKYKEKQMTPICYVLQRAESTKCLPDILLLEILLKNTTEDNAVNEKDIRGLSPIHYAVKLANCIEDLSILPIIEMLRDNGAIYPGTEKLKLVLPENKRMFVTTVVEVLFQAQIQFHKIH